MYNVSRNGAEIGKYPKEEIVDGLGVVTVCWSSRV